MRTTTESTHKVLVVEDDDDLRDLLMEMLELEGFETSGASNGLEALVLLRAPERPNAIVLDLMMPVMSGPEFRAEQLRDVELSRIPVVVLSAAGDGRQQAESLRASAYFAKPVDFDALFDALRSVV
jgi:CheY-like chemotaxis protein